MSTDIRRFRETQREGRGGLNSLEFIEGILATNLDAATGATGKNAYSNLTGRRVATLNCIAWDEDDNFYLTGQTAEVVNRSTTFSAGAGTYLQAYKIGGEFRPLPTFQVVRGRLLTEINSNDKVFQWPKFGLMEILGIGRNYPIVSALSSSSSVTVTATSTPSSTFTVTGDITAHATSGRVLRVALAGDASGDYTVASSSYSSPSTTVTVSESVPSSTLTASSSATVLGRIVIDALVGNVSEMFEVGDTVNIWESISAFTIVRVDHATTTKIDVSETLDATDAVFDDELSETLNSIYQTNYATISGDVRPSVITGHFAILANAGGSNGTYTIDKLSSYTSGLTYIRFVEEIPSGTVTGSSTIRIPRTLIANTIRPDSRLTYSIQSLSAGSPGSVVITNPDSVLSGSDPIREDQMFLEGHTVEITGSNGGVNNGLFKCRKAYTDSGAERTVYLDGVITSHSGALGTMTLKVPPPLAVKGKGMAVLRWRDYMIPQTSIVHCLPPDGDGWHEVISASNAAAYDEVEP